MHIREVLDIVRHRWLTLAACVGIGLVVAFIVFSLVPRSYASSATVYVAPSAADSAAGDGGAFADQQATTYADLVLTPAVLEPVIEERGLRISSAELAERIEAEATPGTTLLRITVADEDPVTAADVANAVAASLTTLPQRLPGEVPTSGAAAAEDESAVALTVVQPAEASSAPSGPGLMPVLTLGLCGGILLGGGLISLRESIDMKVRDHADVMATTNLPVLGVIALASRRGRAGAQYRRGRHQNVPADAEGHDPSAGVREGLHAAVPFGSPQSYVVTSSIGGEGCSTVAEGLARSWAASGRRTLLIDADLKAPSLARRLGTPAAPGLTDALGGRVATGTAMRPTATEGLWIMPGGSRIGPEREALGASAVQDLLERCTDDFDVIVLDAPALLADSDAAMLAQLTTGVVLVVRSGVVERAELAAALRLLHQAHSRVLGAVLTMTPPFRRRRRAAGRTPAHPLVLTGGTGVDTGEAGHDAAGHGGDGRGSEGQGSEGHGIVEEDARDPVGAPGSERTRLDAATLFPPTLPQSPERQNQAHQNPEHRSPGLRGVGHQGAGTAAPAHVPRPPGRDPDRRPAQV